MKELRYKLYRATCFSEWNKIDERSGHGILFNHSRLHSKHVFDFYWACILKNSKEKQLFGVTFLISFTLLFLGQFI